MPRLIEFVPLPETILGYIDRGVDLNDVVAATWDCLLQDDPQRFPPPTIPLYTAAATAAGDDVCRRLRDGARDNFRSRVMRLNKGLDGPPVTELVLKPFPILLVFDRSCH